MLLELRAATENPPLEADVCVIGAGIAGFTIARRFPHQTMHALALESSGCCAPRNTVDFQVRPLVPHSGWPIQLADLEPQYRPADDLFVLGDYAYDESTRSVLGLTTPPLDPAVVGTDF